MAGKWASGAVSAAGTGATIGTSIMPGWGTVIGGVAGGLLGAIGGMFQDAAEEEDKERRREILQEAADALNISYNDVEQKFQKFYDTYSKAFQRYNSSGGSTYDIREKAMSDAADDIMNWDAIANAEYKNAGMLNDDGTINYDMLKFKYTDENGNEKTVDDFINPYAANVISASNDAVQHSAAGAGLGRSTGAANAISKNTMQEYDKIYNTALDAYYKDRGQAYNEYTGYLDNVNKQLSNILEAKKFGISAKQGLGDQFLDWVSSQMENESNLEMEKAKQNANLKIAESQI